MAYKYKILVDFFYEGTASSSKKEIYSKFKDKYGARDRDNWVDRTSSLSFTCGRRLTIDDIVEDLGDIKILDFKEERIDDPDQTKIDFKNTDN